MMSSAHGLEVSKAYARLSIKKTELTLLHMLGQGMSDSYCCSLQGAGDTGTQTWLIHCSWEGMSASCSSLQGAGVKGTETWPTHCCWDIPLKVCLLMSKFLQLRYVNKNLLLKLRAPATQPTALPTANCGQGHPWGPRQGSGTSQVHQSKH